MKMGKHFCPDIVVDLCILIAAPAFTSEYTTAGYGI